MRAMVLEAPHTALKLLQLPIPTPQRGQVLLRNLACGVCRTDLHVIDGELLNPQFPLILGHQIVGTIVELGEGVTTLKIGQRVGVPWLGKSCGNCPYCISGRENLCDHTLYTGYQMQGGFAEYSVAYAQFCFPLAKTESPLHQAPLLCGGLIGYRALMMTDHAKRLGFYGFGSSAHILIQLARYQDREVYVFTRENDVEARELAVQSGAIWVGSSEQLPPVALDATIIFAPVGGLVIKALQAVGKGGIVVCAGIHMSDIPSFPYALLWEERVLRSVANLTRQDGHQFLTLAEKIPIQTSIIAYPLEKANEALNDLRKGRICGSVVLEM